MPHDQCPCELCRGIDGYDPEPGIVEKYLPHVMVAIAASATVFVILVAVVLLISGSRVG